MHNKTLQAKNNGYCQVYLVLSKICLQGQSVLRSGGPVTLHIFLKQIKYHYVQYNLTTFIEFYKVTIIQ